MAQHACVVSYKIVLKARQRGMDLQILHCIMHLLQRISTLKNCSVSKKSTNFIENIIISSESLKNICISVILIEIYVKALQIHHHQKANCYRLDDRALIPCTGY
jgi:hypothetical protein